MKNTKKALLMTLCAVMLVAASVMGTMAYLTSTTGVVTNTFTVGKVGITLDEAKVDEYGDKIDNNGDKVIDDKDRVTENTYKLVPGHNYVKDPTVHVAADSEESYLFVKLTNGITAIEAETTIANQMKENWTLVDNANNIYRYNKTVTAGQNIVVFNNFTISGTADVSTYAGKTITVIACAVQADGLTAETALAAAKWN